ncbi:MAG: alpha-L-arabinofuranosidase [Nibricoccus sp.]
MKRLRLFTPFAAFVALAFMACASASLKAQADQIIYDESLNPAWQNWSWAAVDTASTAAAHAGSTSIAVTPSAWSALSLRHEPFDTSGYGKIEFWINGGSAGLTQLFVVATLNDVNQPGVTIGPIAANTWQHISVPLAALGADSVPNFTGFWIQEGTGNAQQTFYVDDIVLTGSVPTIPAPPLNGGMALYDDAYVNGWQNWSWASVNPAATSPVNSGATSIGVTASPYAALSFHHAALDTQSYTSLTFWIHGGATGGQVLRLSALLSGVAQTGLQLPPLTPGVWQKITIPLADLGVANKPDLTDIWFQEIAGISSPTFYVDDVRLDLAPPPSVVNASVNARDRIRRVDPRMFALNTAIWDGAFNTATTAELLNEIDNQALRFPGGSASDEYHWKTNRSEGQTFEWATSFDDFANIAKVTDAQVFITVNYGTGTPQEAADWVRYANRTKRLGIKYWEVGNENYGTWETDHNNRPHDPVTYANRFKEYARQMKAVDPTIKIGAVIQADEDSNANYTDQTVVNPRTGESHNGWSAVMLATFKQLGVTPDFVVYHRYEQGPGGENDAFLLNSSKGWATDAAGIRQMLDDYLGKKSKHVEINCTENNSVFSNPGKQTTSLVNGLFLADSLGNILKTEFNSLVWWDLRNGQEGGNNNSPSLYGWRRYGDYGIVNAADPAGPADRYPTFYVYKLLTHYARGGETVVAASSDYNGLGIYAVRDPHSRTLNLLLINKHPTTALNTSITIDGFRTGGQAKVYTYGIPQDEAARTGTGSADVTESTIALTGPTITCAPAPYSVTVIKLPRPRGHDHDDDDDCD